MAHLALYRKYRPMTFSDMVGQNAIIQALQNQIRYGQIGHAYLFCGTRGTGKTTTAKILARAVNCLHPVDGNPCNECELCREAESGFHMVEIDAASNRGVDNIRTLREEVQYTPSKGKYKVYIIDEVHMLTTEAFNALLKTLEEPPQHVIFILATTEPNKVLPTILSRCQRYDFKRISTSEMTDRLRYVCEKEDIQAEEEALHYIAALADGGMRDALSILDQCHAYYMQEAITLPKVREVLGAVDTLVFTRMTEALIRQDVAAMLETVSQIYREGRDPVQFVNAWNEYLRNVLISKVLAERGRDLIEADPEQMQRIYSQSEEIPSEKLTYYIEELAKLENKMKTASQKRVLLEIGLISLLGVQEEPVVSIKELKTTDCNMAHPEPDLQRKAKPEPVKRRPEQIPAAVSAAPGQKTAKVLSQWPEIRQKLTTKWGNLKTLDYVRLEPGTGDDELVLRAKSIYCRQLEQNNGEKLKLIEDQIQEATGIRIRIRTAGEDTPKGHSEDLSDIKNLIHTDVKWRN